MKILVCSLEAPLPPPNGLRLQVGALVEELRKQHDVRVLALRGPDQLPVPDGTWLRTVPGKKEGRVIGAARWFLGGGWPPGTEDAADRLHRPLRQELRRFEPEVVHVTSGRLALLETQLRHHRSVLVALDAWHLNVDAEASGSRGMARLVVRLKSRQVRAFERTVYRRFDGVIVVSEQDRDALLEIQPSLTIEVIPNGVDADAFEWDGTSRDRGVIIFTGVMSYSPNVTAAEFLARRVFPLVRRVVPGSRVVLVGREPAPKVRALRNLAGVDVVGEVPDMRPWLSRSGVYACPMLSGTGIKNKLLEAMANGLAVVATPLALQGLSVTPGTDVLVGNDEGALADHLARLIEDRQLADRIGAAGRAYVRTHHTWAAVAAEYVRVYREVIGGA